MQNHGGVSESSRPLNTVLNTRILTKMGSQLCGIPGVLFQAGLEKLRDTIQGNMGFIFATNCSLDDIRECLTKHTRQSAAKAGQVSIVDWFIPAGPTGMDPSQTAFFQVPETSPYREPLQ